MIKRDDANNWQGIACDTCGKDAPPAVEIMRAFGLERLGWYCSGGVHICADCPHPTEDRKFRFPHPDPISNRGAKAPQPEQPK